MDIAPRVSVVMPCFNHGEFLSEAIESVRATKRDDVEIIVVDDGSTDERTRKETEAIAARGVTVIRKENGGPASARNAGIAAAHGEYIFPLDGDDRMSPGCLDRGIPILDAHPSIGVVYSDGEFFGTRSGRWSIGPFDTNRLLQANQIPCCALFRRRIWEQLGGYDESRVLWGREDWDFWLGVFENRWEFHYVPEILFSYRIAEGSMLKRARPYLAEAERFIALKHGPLYRQAWLRSVQDHQTEIDSGTATLRNLRRIIKARLKHKLRKNGTHS